MAITDELRRYVKDHTNWDVALTTYPPQRTMTYHEGAIDAIADRIDTAHEALAAKSDRQREQLAAMEDALRRRNEGELKRRWQREIDALRDERDELREAVRLSEAKDSDMVELPKDADGEPIHIGDTVEWLGEPHHPITVVGVGKSTLFYIDDDANAQWTTAITKRHHAKTVEDVLREFAGTLASAENNWGSDVDDAIAEYAKRLRLAESEKS